jgi:hypothetical protein
VLTDDATVSRDCALSGFLRAPIILSCSGPRSPMVLFRLCELLREVAPELPLPSAAQVPHGTLSTLHAACMRPGICYMLHVAPARDRARPAFAARPAGGRATLAHRDQRPHDLRRGAAAGRSPLPSLRRDWAYPGLATSALGLAYNPVSCGVPSIMPWLSMASGGSPDLKKTNVSRSFRNFVFFRRSGSGFSPSLRWRTTPATRTRRRASIAARSSFARRPTCPRAPR